MTSMPEEDEYSDDTDFLGEELIQLEFILPVAAKVFKEWSLNINESKTDFIHFYYTEPDKDNKEVVLDDEPWRKSKLLGSYMCSSYDIQQKCILGNLAFSNFNDVWLQGKRISLPRLINVYEAMVVSVMMYNCSSWAATKDTLKKLDVCHRKHLRKIINVKWPQTISNDKLYEICNTECLSERVRLARWKMLGHILRSPDNTPAALSLVHAIKGSVAKKRSGSHKANLLKVLRDDMKSMPIDRTSEYAALRQRPTLKKLKDIEDLRLLAHNKSLWRDIPNFKLAHIRI